MNEKLIAVLTLIARNPSIRTVEIADRVDCDTDQVQPMLQQQIDAGDILVIPVTAPNGRPANGFMFTDKARKGADFRALFDAGAPAAPAAAKPTPVPVPTPVPQPPAEPDSSLTKVEVAIRYVKAKGSASPQQLRELLKLEAKQHPMAYLGGALKDGRLKLVNGHYYLGNGTPPERLAPEKRKAAAPKAEPAPAPVATPAVETPVPALEQEPIPVPAAPRTRCGLWSDGVLELQRDGKTVVELTADEQQLIAQFRQLISTGAALEVCP